jgi:molecular chaperone GrpE
MADEIKQPDELAETKDKYLRAIAELENTRKRAASDIENAARAGGIAIAEQFLPLVDAIDKAAELSPDDEGISALKKAADNALAKIGITRIETAGEILNPQIHNAILAEESDAAANMIIRELQGGFMFGDSVLRAPMVVVSKGKENEAA